MSDRQLRQHLARQPINRWVDENRRRRTPRQDTLKSVPDHNPKPRGKELRDTYDLDKTLVGFRVTFCLVRESVSSIMPRDESPKTKWRKGRMGQEVKLQLHLPSGSDRVHREPHARISIVPGLRPMLAVLQYPFASHPVRRAQHNMGYSVDIGHI